MTAEIGILNRACVVLAADSAVTVSDKSKSKAFNSAHKLFSLSKVNPVGIMIFDNASFMGVPWETIIKVYREKLNKDTYDYLKDYANDFISYLLEDQRFVMKSSEETFVRRKFNLHFEEILKSVNRIIADTYNTIKPSEADVAYILSNEVKRYLDHIKKYKFVDGFDDDFTSEFINKHGGIVIGIIENIVKFKVDKDTIDNLLLMATYIISKDIFSINTGIVISGYGEKEIFPVLYQYNVEGIICNRLKYKLKITREIGAEQGEKKVTAAIVPFAQKEMVSSFVEGIDPYLKRELLNSLGNVFNQLPNIVNDSLSQSSNKIILSEENINNLKQLGLEIYDSIRKNLEKYQFDKYTAPIIDIVTILPKEEVAAVAEALLNLTSTKRKMSIDTETVGGPIDVAVITKGDGFIWIKRKHYFNPELNHSFFKNYIRGE